jgi:hypothetical protein
MSAPRQHRHPKIAFAARFGRLACAALALAATGAAAQSRVVSDPQTGIAIGGFDPVSYFAAPHPELGRVDLEYALDGTVWCFRNTGNRAAFAAHPDVYAPQFGGYDPVAIARGVSVPGHPLIWLVKDERLYFFYDAAARAAFAADADRVIASARSRWPEVSQTLP